MFDVQSRSSIINVYISPKSTECRLDRRKWGRETQTECISGAFQAFQDRALVRMGNLMPL